MKKWSNLLCVIVLICSFCFMPIPVSAAESVIPLDKKMYTTSGTYVYAKPDLTSNVVCILDRFINVTVTGVTQSGFYEIDLNGKYYIPGIFLVDSLNSGKTQKELALEKVEKIANAYQICLEQTEHYNGSFGLCDINNDSIPELFFSSGKEIYTYYDERPVMIYYSEYGDKFYFSKKYQQLIGKYTWNKKDYYEVLSLDYSVLPWGTLRCFLLDISPYKNDMSAISYDYINDSTTRNDLKNIIKKKMSL